MFRKVLTIVGGSHLVVESQSARDKHAKDARTLSLTQVYMTKERLAKHERRELEDTVFIEVDARWVNLLHASALVITAQIANSDLH